MTTEKELIQQARNLLADSPVIGNLNFELFLYATCAASETITLPDEKRIMDSDIYFNRLQYKVDAVLDGLANKIVQYKKSKGQLDAQLGITTNNKRK
jgi:hypothetical protein